MNKLTVLLFSANPETKNLRLNAEQRDIQEQVELAERQRQKASFGGPMTPIEFIAVTATRVRDLPRMLKLHMPHVLHFSGHGAAQGELVLETDSGRRVSVAPDVLASILAPFKSSLRLVLLNACYSQLQAAGIVENIDCCIGMTTAVEDAVAVTFARAFYELVTLGSSVGEAFHLARQELATLEDGRRWREVPQLESRRGVNANQVFLTATPPGSKLPPVALPETERRPPELVLPVDSPPALVQLAELPPLQLSASQVRRNINELLLSDSELTAFLQSKYPRSARQISDNMQRTAKLNVLLTYEPDLHRLRGNLIDFYLSSRE